MSYIRYDIKSSKVIMWSRLDSLSSIFEESHSKMRCDEIIGQDSKISNKIFSMISFMHRC